VTRVTVLSVLARTDDEAGGLFLDRPRGREAAGGHHLIESSARLLLTRSLTADWGLGDGASRRQHNNTARVSYISLTDQVGGKRRLFGDGDPAEAESLCNGFCYASSSVQNLIDVAEGHAMEPRKSGLATFLFDYRLSWRPHSSFRPTISAYWPEADIEELPASVRFRGDTVAKLDCSVGLS
jgi:hypothetical protein